MFRRLTVVLCALTLIALLSGCDLLSPPPKPSAEPPAASMLPNLPGHRRRRRRRQPRSQQRDRKRRARQRPQDGHERLVRGLERRLS